MLLYDSRCGVCRGSVCWLLRRRHRIEAIDLYDSEVARRFPALSSEQLTRQLHAVDDSGRLYVGARALAEALRYRGGWASYLALLWRLPGFAPVAQLMYRGFAAHRPRDSVCGNPRI
ncbi:MAG TPA: DUF393 domain-containing protein [Candidatus Binataceae bacterium]|nr:DUF393 domain-containing protein [Candidatus Binataceae bacterium]